MTPLLSAPWPAWTALLRWITHASVGHAGIYDPAYVIYYNLNAVVVLSMFVGGFAFGLFIDLYFPNTIQVAIQRAYIVLASGLLVNFILGFIKTVEYAPHPVWLYHVAYTVLDAVAALGVYVAIRWRTRRRLAALHAILGDP